MRNICLKMELPFVKGAKFLFYISPILISFFILLNVGLLSLSIKKQHVFEPISNHKVLPLAFENTRTFTLKHIYHQGVSPETMDLFRRLDVDPTDMGIFIDDSDIMSTTAHDNIVHLTRPTSRKLYRRRPPRGTKLFLNNTEAFFDSLQTQLYNTEDDKDLWPDLTNQTILSLAKMAYNAYYGPEKINSTDWYDLGIEYPVNSSFGWETAGVRGHVFESTNSSRRHLIVSIKGTSAGLYCGSVDTCDRDKFNDNHLFSCCTARLNWRWSPVYECGTASPKICNHTCVESNMRRGELYYWAALKIVDEILDSYPDSLVWLVGHSLGGAIASLVGNTYGLPVVTFETPGEKFAAQRLHVFLEPALPNENIPIWHVGHTADPIYLGTCNQYGAISYCYSGGYDMETRCHTGRRCVFNVTGRMEEKVDIRTHTISYLIEKVLKQWKWEEWGTPTCEKQVDLNEKGDEIECEDCKDWDFIH